MARIESSPSGAQVYLLRGTQRIALGKTPLDYRAEFHSEQSILRIAVEHPGYNPVRLELSASRPRLVAQLTAKSHVVDPATHSDPALRSLQREINPALTQALSSVLQPMGDWTADLAGEARLRRTDNRTLLTIPLSVASQRPAPGGRPADMAAIAKEVWDKVAHRAALAVEGALGRPRGLDGIVIESRFDLQRHGFRVDHRITSRTEMRCVPGGQNKMVSKYHACATRDARGFCVSGYKNEYAYVHDPCASMQPFTLTDTTFDASSAETRDLARAVYLVPLNIDIDNLGFSSVDVVMTDARGKLLWQQGKLKDSFLK